MSTETVLGLDEQVVREVMRWDDATCEAVIDVSGHLPRCSSHIDAAWDVVDEMEERGWDWYMRGDSSRCFVTFERPDPDNNPDGLPVEMITYTGAATIAPEAICLAALAAVRGEKEKQT